jgi:hypothetical protein
MQQFTTFPNFYVVLKPGAEALPRRVAASAGNGSRLTRFRVTEYNLGP